MPRAKLAVVMAIAAILITIIILPITYAQTTTTPPTTITQTCIITGTVTTPDQCVANTLPIILLALSFSFMIAAVVYMFAQVLNYPTLHEWYKEELWEGIKSAIIVVVIVGVLVFASGVAAALAGSTAATSGTSGALSTNLANLYGVSYQYLGTQLGNAYSAYSAILGLTVGVGFLKSISISAWIPVPIPPIPLFIGTLQSGFNADLFQSNYLYTSPEFDSKNSFSFINSATSLVILPTLAVFQVQYDLFYAIVGIGLGVLIPIGLIFRAIPIVRDIGGTLIALGIGASLIYPALLAIVNLPISNYIPQLNTPAAQAFNCGSTPALICSFFNAGITSISSIVGASSFLPLAFAFGPRIAGMSTSQLATAATSGGIGSITAAEVGAFTAPILQLNGKGYLIGLTTPLFVGSIYPTLNFVIDNALVIILQLLLFALDIMIGLLILGGVTSALGGKVRLGIGKFSL